MSGGYRYGADFWRDTAARYGMAEALVICESYLGTQLAHKQPQSEHGFCQDLWGRYCEDEKGAHDSYIARIISHLDYGIAKEVENPLAAVEVATEQNYDMIDGILSNMAAQMTEAPCDKPSVLGQLHEARKNPVPHKPKEEKGGREVSL